VLKNSLYNFRIRQTTGQWEKVSLESHKRKCLNSMRKRTPNKNRSRCINSHCSVRHPVHNMHAAVCPRRGNCYYLAILITPLFQTYTAMHEECQPLLPANDGKEVNCSSFSERRAESFSVEHAKGAEDLHSWGTKSIF
jgi:hypothetical protein